MKKIILYFAVFLSCTTTLVLGQAAKSKRKTAYFKNAETEFGNLRYMYAIPFYKSSLKHENVHDSIACLHLAESYWRVRNYDSALIYYQQFENKFGSIFSVSQHLAELSATQKKYAAASAIYKKLLKDIPNKNNKLLAERLKGFSNVEPFFSDSLAYAVYLLKLNTNQQDFSPQYYRGGMVFVSNRYPKPVVRREFGWDGLPFANIFWVKDTADLYIRDSIPSDKGYTYRYNKSIKANDDYTARTSNDNNIILTSSMRSAYSGEIHRLAKFSDDLTTKYNYGPLCFSKNGTTVYFTRNSKQSYEGRYNLEICEADFENGLWTNIRIMPFVQPAYDFYHPAISRDGQRLYFCSNQPGGMGGSDIYYINLGEKADKSTAFNLGDKVNTAGDELFPTINGDVLYFSSDGFAGLGGIDVYKTSNETGVWKTPVNLGYPVNSPFDDFGIIFNSGKTKGFFSSNRLGSDDIYTFTYAPFYMRLAGTVLSRKTLRRLDSVKIVMRSVNIEKPTIDTFTTNITGNFNFPVKPGHHYVLQFTRNGYVEDSLHINTVVQKLMQLQPVLLTPIEPPAPPVEKDRDGDGIVDSKDKCPDVKGTKENFGCPDIQSRLNELAKMVFFKTDKDELTPAAIKPLTEAYEILAEYPNTTLVIEGHTDSRASAAHNKDLSQRRANSVKTFFVKKGLQAGRFTTFGYGLERPIGDNETEEGRALNRRVSIKATFHE